MSSENWQAFRIGFWRGVAQASTAIAIGLFGLAVCGAIAITSFVIGRALA